VSIEEVTSNRGAVLLAELKALVDSFPQHQRRDLIKICETVFRGLNAGHKSRHVSPGAGEATTVDDRQGGTTSSLKLSRCCTARQCDTSFPSGPNSPQTSQE
jgi:hypothetical protein